MIVHDDVVQGSPEWMALHIGLPTSSMFHLIVTPKRWAASESKTRRMYMCRLLAEELLNMSLESLDHLEWIARGKELEPQAVRAYEFEEEVQTAPIGFITSDDGRVGTTPDRRIIGANGALEIKCPSSPVHLDYSLFGFGDEYLPQVMGQLWIGEFDFSERYSFYPGWPAARDRADRDEVKIRTMSDLVERFCDEKDEAMHRLKTRGFFPAPAKRLMTAVDDQAAAHGDIEQLQRDLGDYLGA